MIYYFANPFSGRRSRDNRVHIQITGSGCDLLEPADQLHLLLALRALDFSCSRVDIALDDHSGRIDIDRIDRITRLRHFTGFRQVDWDSAGIPTGTLDERGRPRILYNRRAVNFGFRGSRGCGKYLRIYDKALETQSPGPWIRFEAEFTNRKAKQAFAALYVAATTGPAIFARTLAQLVVGTVNFVHRRHRDHHASRWRPYRFWRWLVEVAADGTRIVLSRPCSTPKTEADLEAWVRKTAGPTLAAIKLFHEMRVHSGEHGPRSWPAFIARVAADGQGRLSHDLIELLDRLAPGWRMLSGVSTSQEDPWGTVRPPHQTGQDGHEGLHQP